MTFARTILPVLSRIAIRLGAFAVGLVAYDWAYSQAVEPTSGDADIGKGLLAFLLLAGIAFVWGLLDGNRHGFGVTALVWLVVSILFAFGWEVVLLTEEGGMSLGELVRSDLGTVLFIAQLLFAPALVGAALGWLVGRGRSADPARLHT